MSLRYNPVVLIINDGLGIAPPSETNAVSQADTPFLDKLCRHFPTMLLEASGLQVGLPRGEMGNSETGHFNIGTGKLIYQSLPRINKSIREEDFFEKEEFLKCSEKVKKNNGDLHLMGLLGEGGVHSHQKHLHALLDFCKKEDLNDNVYLHLFLDGRDTDKDAGIDFLDNLLEKMKQTGVGTIASMGGRYYGMDRNENWDRIEKNYKAIIGNSDNNFTNPKQALQQSYENEVYDEKFEPATRVENGSPITTIKNNDSVIFFNFRADRARQMTKAFVLEDFNEFDRDYKENLEFTTFIEYEKGLPVNVAYPPEIAETPIAKVFSENGFTQKHIAETEKYAHVTFFLNGQIENPFEGEERKIVPSPSVPSYDQKPEMSAFETTDEMVEAIKKGEHEFLVMNFANPDMVGHTGNLDAAIKGVEAVDKNIKRVTEETVKQGGIVFITSDHGNAESMVNIQTEENNKEHTIYPVPFITASKMHKDQTIEPADSLDLSKFKPRGVLTDVAPTILEQVGLSASEEMTGTNLLKQLI
ncbi:MAG: 2,3-bisphosphoglycerate-independent phosphoglycerate mutase [Candidatus Magasanikbacteria bacterium]